MPRTECHACGLEFAGMSPAQVREHMIACTGIDPDEVTDRIELPRTERADVKVTRKDRQG